MLQVSLFKKQAYRTIILYIQTDPIKDVQTTENGLRGLYPGYDRFSDPRKTALVDMGFNLGIPTLKSKFPKFNDAVNRGDWNVAADESHRDLNQRGDKRNKDTADQLRYNR